MANDPYGYRDSSEGARYSDAEASTAMWTGVISALCAAIGPCSCYVTYLIAMPLGLYAMWAGWQTREGAGPNDHAGRSMAAAGILSGAIGALIGGLFLAFIAAYFVFIFFVAGIGAFNQ